MIKPSVFAIGDLHLPGGENKPMNVFGEHWNDYADHIRADWENRVSSGDIVLIPGDISWAMTLEKAASDLEWIGRLPGKKVLLRGNHDFWWNSIGKLRAMLPEGMYAIQNDCVEINDLVICGSRGWSLPVGADAETKRIYQRELQRLSLSLASAERIRGGRKVIAMTHFPPMGERGAATEMTRLLAEYRVDFAVYAHLHGMAIHNAFYGEIEGVPYQLVSCDSLNFKLCQLPL